MKKVFLLLSLVLLTVVFLNYSGGKESAVAAGAGNVADKFVLALNVARLYAAEPDEKLAMPVKGVTRAQVADSWHAPRDGGARQHEGQDILAPRGTPVLSATDGYVVSVGENKLGGQTVSVVGAGGRVYYYAHLDKYADDIGFGDRVTTATVLGYVGTTGNAAGTPPHLHFGVYSSGGAINPLPLLSDRVEVKPPVETTRDRQGKKRGR